VRSPPGLRDIVGSGGSLQPDLSASVTSTYLASAARASIHRLRGLLLKHTGHAVLPSTPASLHHIKGQGIHVDSVGLLLNPEVWNIGLFSMAGKFRRIQQIFSRASCMGTYLRGRSGQLSRQIPCPFLCPDLPSEYLTQCRLPRRGDFAQCIQPPVPGSNNAHSFHVSETNESLCC
jgi:hypothetical protein